MTVSQLVLQIRTTLLYCTAGIFAMLAGDDVVRIVEIEPRISTKFWVCDLAYMTINKRGID